MSIEKGDRCVLPNPQQAILSSSSNNELNCTFLEITVPSFHLHLFWNPCFWQGGFLQEYVCLRSVGPGDGCLQVLFLWANNMGIGLERLQTRCHCQCLASSTLWSVGRRRFHVIFPGEEPRPFSQTLTCPARVQAWWVFSLGSCPCEAPGSHRRTLGQCVLMHLV